MLFRSPSITITAIDDYTYDYNHPSPTGVSLIGYAWTTSGGASCSGSPVTCVLPNGTGANQSKLELTFSVYTVSLDDLQLADQQLKSTLSTIGTATADTDMPASSSATDLSTIVVKHASAATTAINNDSSLTSVAGGTTVSDTVTVTGKAGGPVPTGTVTLTWYAGSLTCETGAGVTTSSETLTLNGSGVATSAQKSPLPGSYSYLAHYNGNGTYAEVDATCEPLTVRKKEPSLSTVASASSSTIGPSVKIGRAHV